MRAGLCKALGAGIVLFSCYCLWLRLFQSFLALHFLVSVVFFYFLASAGFCLLLFFRVFVDSVLFLFIAVCCFVLLFAFVCYVFVVVVA